MFVISTFHINILFFREIAYSYGKTLITNDFQLKLENRLQLTHDKSRYECITHASGYWNKSDLIKGSIQLWMKKKKNTKSNDSHFNFIQINYESIEKPLNLMKIPMDQ